MLESGRYTNMTELAGAEKINASYLARILRLILLAPDIVQDLLDGDPELKIPLDQLTVPFPLEWSKQREYLVSHHADHQSEVS